MPSSIVFTLPPKLKAITKGSPESVSDYYVYELQCDDLPFYVGYGKRRKAWNIHSEEVEDMKRFGRDFQVVIVADKLNKGMAQLLKANLISKYRKADLYLANQR
jgi:hypothetical protein